MNATRTDDLRTILADLFQGAADHYALMAEVTSEIINISLRNEYRSAISILLELVDEKGCFPSSKERLLVRQALAQYLDDIEESFPIRALHVQSVIGVIDAGEQGHQSDNLSEQASRPSLR